MAGSKAPRASNKQQNGHDPKQIKSDVKPTPNSSPVLEAISKRIRNTKKRLRGLEDIEAKKNAGQELNSDQARHLAVVFNTHHELALASKPSLLAIIDELDKLLKTLPVPLAEETSAAAATAREEALASIPEPEPVKPTKTDEEWLAEKKIAVDKAVAAAEKKAADKAKTAANTALRDGINTLMELIYYANVFDPFVPFPHPAQYERHACLTYATHNNVALTAEDLDALALFGKLITSKSYGAAISHAEALEHCKDLAFKYISDPSTQLPGTQITGDAVKSKLAAVLSTDFCVVVPRGIQTVQQPTTGTTTNNAPASNAAVVLTVPRPTTVVKTQHHQQQQRNKTRSPPPPPPAAADSAASATTTAVPPTQQQQQPEEEEEEEASGPQAPSPDAIPPPQGLNLVQHLFGNNTAATGTQQPASVDAGSTLPAGDTNLDNVTDTTTLDDKQQQQQQTNRPPRPYYKDNNNNQYDGGGRQYYNRRGGYWRGGRGRGGQGGGSRHGSSGSLNNAGSGGNSATGQK